MSIADVNDVKGGEYELVAAQFDKILSKPGEPFDFKRYRQGDRITLDVEEAKRLWLAGAIVEPGARQRAAAEAARAQYEAALAALPDDVRQQVLAQQAGILVEGVSQTGTPVQPPKGALKPDWVDYAVALGWDRSAAEALKKPELQAAIADAEKKASESVDDVPGAQAPESGTENGNSDSAGADTGTGDGADDSEPKPLPLNAAPHEDWIAAAAERGIDEAEASKLTKQELINLLS